MISMNLRMAKVIMPNYEYRPQPEAVRQIVNSIISETLLYADCVIYDPKEEIKSLSISPDKLMESFVDRTASEAFQNDIRVNRDTLHLENIPHLVLNLSEKLKMAYPQREFAIVASIDEFDNTAEICIRFHTVRQNEPLWCSQELDRFIQPTMLAII